MSRSGGKSAELLVAGDHRGKRVDGIQSPWKWFGAERAGHLGGPVVVGGVAGVKTIVERLHESIELRPEAAFERLHIAFAFTPLGTAVLEPNLKDTENVML